MWNRALTSLKLVYLYLQYFILGLDEEGFQLLKGNYLLDLDAYPAAAKAFQRALCETQAPWVHASLGWCYLQMGLADKAASSLRHAYAKTARPEFGVSLGRALVELGETEEGERLYWLLKDSSGEHSAEFEEQLVKLEDALDLSVCAPQVVTAVRRTEVPPAQPSRLTGDRPRERSVMTWWKRVLVAFVVGAAQWVVAIACTVVYFITYSESAVLLSAFMRDVEELGITLLITVLAPSLAFWGLRRFVRSARSLSWTIVTLVIAVNLAFVFMLEITPLYDQLTGTIVSAAFVVAPFMAAFAGTYVPRGQITFGAKVEPRSGRAVERDAPEKALS